MPDDGASTNICAFRVCLSGSCRVHAACEEKQQTGSASYWAGRVKYQRSLYIEVHIHILHYCGEAHLKSTY